MKNIKTAAVFHGRNCTPDLFWYQDIGKYLQSLGYQVWIPELPSTKIANLNDWLPFVLESDFNFNSNTILIGHSAGAPLILSVLERLNQKIDKVFLVAGAIEMLNDKQKRPILQETYNFEKIKANVNKIYIINSDNDPYGADDEAGRIIQERIGGELIIVKGEGHFGSLRVNQQYSNFPLLKKLIKSEL